jgi:hypothetical protein
MPTNDPELPSGIAIAERTRSLACDQSRDRREPRDCSIKSANRVRWHSRAQVYARSIIEPTFSMSAKLSAQVLDASINSARVVRK